jgi:Holliday junction resolvase RusA-like endonuclease
MATTYVSAAGVKFQKAVLAAVIEQLGQHSPLQGRLCVSMLFYGPSARKYDISNFVKTTEDALTKASVWVDDEQVDVLFLWRKPIDRQHPRVEIQINDLGQVNEGRGEAW